jgi:formylglycine-generating enzyme required for sulfatase activity/energy-coupling factor transporter ATP-binding protein EcfA2
MRDQLPEDMRAQFDAQIAALEALLQPPAAPPEQTITNTAPNQGAQGVFYGSVYLYGQRGKSAEQLLAGYLQRQVQHWSDLPLQGIREQKSAYDTIAISLEQVYTQLSITGLASLVEREVIEGEALQQFDARRYLEQHVGDHVLPLQQRWVVQIPAMLDSSTPFDSLIKGEQLHSVHSVDTSGSAVPLSLLHPDFSAETLSGYARTFNRLTFFGPQLITEAIAAHQHLVVLGEPGSGKSTVLRYLALTLAHAGTQPHVELTARLEGWHTLGDHGRLLPLFLPLLPLAKYLAAHADRPGNADDLWNHIAEHLEAGGRYEGLAAAVHEELEAGRVLLMLDGLDEVVGADSRRRVVRAVQAFADQYRQCRIVVTCRVRAYEGQHNAEWQLPNWPTVTLEDWNIGQMQHFVQAWYAAAAASSGMPAEKRDERIAALKHALDRRRDMQRLGKRPLLLTIMALVHFNDGRLPEERVRLYSRCVDLLLGQWELAREDGSGYGTLADYIGLPDADITRLRPLLQALAFTAHEASTADQPGSLGRDTLRVMVADMLSQRGHPNPWQGAERFLDYTDVRSGLLQASDARDVYVFPHLTFQEYLAGLELVRGVEFVQRIMDRRADDRWRVPILLGLGHLVSEGALSVPYRILNKLIHMKGRTPEQQQRDLLLAAEIGEDVGWQRLEAGDDLFEHLRGDLAAALAEVVEGTTLPAKERVQAGTYLGVLGDPRPGVCTLPPAMVRIEGGKFMMGDEDEAHPVTVASFEIGRYPVTNAQYKLFIDDAGYNPDAPWWDESGRAWLLKRDPSFLEQDIPHLSLKTIKIPHLSRELIKVPRMQKYEPESWQDRRFGAARTNHPVVDICWYEAMAFCRWLTQQHRYNPEGYRYTLPAESEWEFTACGSERRTYPWGDEPWSEERANMDGYYQGTTPVGCFEPGASPSGLHDLTGNVLEWTRSIEAPYPYKSDDGRESLGDLSEQRMVLRGIGWLSPAFRPVTHRFMYSVSFNFNSIGFRLVRYPPNKA